MMIKRLVACLFAIIVSLHVMAIDAVVAHSIFYIPDPGKINALMPALETYWEVNPHTLRFSSTPEKTIIARIKTDIVFTSDNAIVKEDHFILQTPPRANVNALTTLNIIDLRRYYLKPGKIKMVFTLTDLSDSTNRFTFTDTFTIQPPQPSVFYSGFELLDTVLESDKSTVFLKNGRQQIPVCTNFLDDPRRTLHYYAELYNTSKIDKNDYPLVQKVLITRKDHEAHFGNFIKTDTIHEGTIVPVTGGFDIGTLPSGNYFLYVGVENNVHRLIATKSLFFQRLNNHLVIDTVKKAVAAIDTGIENVNVLDLNKTFVAKYTLPQVISILKMLLPFTDYGQTETINRFLKTPDDMYMRYFIYNFFSNINKKDPGKAWKDFAEKITAVNKLYSIRGTPGYQSERGFIYLRYGAPTEIITVENESGTLPYEIWQYNTLTQINHKDITDAVFLFYKPNQMTADYKLLHSTVSGETQNSAWRSFLYVNGEGGNNMNSRAEQFLGTR